MSSTFQPTTQGKVQLFPAFEFYRIRDDGAILHALLLETLHSVTPAKPFVLDARDAQNIYTLNA